MCVCVCVCDFIDILNMDTYFEIRRFLTTITSNNNRRSILDIFICGYMLEITHK